VLGVALLALLAGAGRFPRARPEPRVLPKDGNSATGAGVVAVASAGAAPDDSVDDMSMLLVESACLRGGA
jgi:hypothetical protein